jgi:hypothetical protein
MPNGTSLLYSQEKQAIVSLTLSPFEPHFHVLNIMAVTSEAMAVCVDSLRSRML